MPFHLAGTLVGSNDTLCWMGVPDAPREGENWGGGGRTPCQNMHLQISAATLRIETELFRLLPNCFGAYYNYGP